MGINLICLYSPLSYIFPKWLSFFVFQCYKDISIYDSSIGAVCVEMNQLVICMWVLLRASVIRG